MRKELNELANQLQVLAHNLEEIEAPIPLHETDAWKEFCGRVFDDTHGRINLVGEEPLTCLHILYMNIPNQTFNRAVAVEEARQFVTEFNTVQPVAEQPADPRRVRLWNPRIEGDTVNTVPGDDVTWVRPMEPIPQEIERDLRLQDMQRLRTELERQQEEFRLRAAVDRWNQVEDEDEPDRPF